MILLLSPTETEGAFLKPRGEAFSFLGRPGVRGKGWVFLVSGIGKVNTALTLAAYAAKNPVDWVLLFGLAGAYPASRLRPGDLVLAAEEVQADLGVRGSLEALGFPALERGGVFYYNRFPLESSLTGRLSRALGVPAGVLLTRDAVSETFEEAQALESQFGALAENMEGAALAQAALALDLPAAELRAISNPAGVRDRKAWRVEEALESLRVAVLHLLGLEQRSLGDLEG
ncbi:MAG: futalosine hydrolase [Thermaceae bacterium]